METTAADQGTTVDLLEKETRVDQEIMVELAELKTIVEPEKMMTKPSGQSTTADQKTTWNQEAMAEPKTKA
ncbi:hypothetical protein ROHU_033587 [Labeo rohita]|uniref:Uncharacterized protein n=1 Tax=Labeo rohita TaxID=84645 RepID=A0A498LA99_LABRO|nr:hypothetical protein ROHU_013036 [Labeo rohita]RXN05098.1 hypothetical protein ROHU_033587 [Labeo rohita]